MKADQILKTIQNINFYFNIALKDIDVLSNNCFMFSFDKSKIMLEVLPKGCSAEVMGDMRGVYEGETIEELYVQIQRDMLNDFVQLDLFAKAPRRGI